MRNTVELCWLLDRVEPLRHVQRLFSFMLATPPPVPLQVCAAVVLLQVRRDFVRTLSAGTPAWHAAIALGIIHGTVLDLRDPEALAPLSAWAGDVLAREREREHEARTAAALRAAIG